MNIVSNLNSPFVRARPALALSWPNKSAQTVYPLFHRFKTACTFEKLLEIMDKPTINLSAHTASVLGQVILNMRMRQSNTSGGILQDLTV